VWLPQLCINFSLFIEVDSEVVKSSDVCHTFSFHVCLPAHNGIIFIQSFKSVKKKKIIFPRHLSFHSGQACLWAATDICRLSARRDDTLWRTSSLLLVTHTLFAIADDSINACLLAFLTIVVETRWEMKKTRNFHSSRACNDLDVGNKENKFSYSN
jgi:hypothetical protein